MSRLIAQSINPELLVHYTAAFLPFIKIMTSTLGISVKDLFQLLGSVVIDDFFLSLYANMPVHWLVKNGLHRRNGLPHMVWDKEDVFQRWACRLD